MFIQSINSFSNYKNYKQPYQHSIPSFKSQYMNVGDSFVRSKLNPETIVSIKDLHNLAQKCNLSQEFENYFLKLINNNNHQICKNIFSNIALVGGFHPIFNNKKTNTRNDITELLICTTPENKETLEYYTSLGCTSDIILEQPTEFINENIKNLNLKKFSPKVIENIIEELNPNTLKTVTMLVNQTDLNNEEIISFINETKSFSETDLTYLEENIKNGMANYFSEIVNNKKHPLRKELNTVDFQTKCPYFLNIFDYYADKKHRIYEFLKYPLKSEENICKTFRNMGSLMGKVYSNSMKEFDEYEARREYYSFFTQNFEKTFGLITITDKETSSHIFDKGFHNAANYLDLQKYLTKEDVETLSNIIKQGKRQNRKGEYVDISAKSKVYTCNLININRKILANTTGELNIKGAITKIKDGIVPDFKDIEIQLKTKVLNQFGFSNDDVKNLDPKNIDWDIHNMYLLTLPRNKNSEMDIVVQEASKGNFENFIYDSNNIYGQHNLATKEMFLNAGLNYSIWDNGIPPKKFEVAGEELSISLWKHRPQESIFNGTYTTCCTSLDGTNGNSMAKYLLSRVFNIMEIKNQYGETIAQSRFFMANPKSPILLIDNIEVNNNFKKKLYCSTLKDKFIEEIFQYYRTFASKLSNAEIPLYFSRDNNKLYNSDDIGFPRSWIYINDIIGELALKDAYCNVITQSINALPKKNTNVYEVTNPIGNVPVYIF